ncbi:hypothetical protein BDP27DRAFT_1310060, partial [Rhodocollybia butyracea]
SQFSPTNVQDDCWDTEASIPVYSEEEHSYIRPDRLNMLANHGYINRSGREIFLRSPCVCQMAVYNLSLPLTLFFNLHWAVTASSRSSLSSRRWSIPSMSYHSRPLITLLLRSWSQNCTPCIVGSPDHPSYAPDMTMYGDYYAMHTIIPPFSSSFEKLAPTGGLTLQDLASLRVSRESFLATPSRLSNVHEQVALGECALTWLLFSKEPSVDSDSSIPTSYLAQWFGEERLPDGWVRPIKLAGRVKRDMELVNEKKGRAKKARIESNISGEN